MLERARTKKAPGGDLDVERRINTSGIVAFKEWEAARRLQQPIWLDRRTDPEREGPVELEDLNAKNPLKDIYQGELRDYVQRLLDQLPPRHRVVVRLRYGMEDGTEHTLESIGGRLKISRERVRQIQSEAIERISRLAAEQDPAMRPLGAQSCRPSRSIRPRTLARRRLTRLRRPSPRGRTR